MRVYIILRQTSYTNEYSIERQMEVLPHELDVFETKAKAEDYIKTYIGGKKTDENTYKLYREYKDIKYTETIRIIEKLVRRY